MIGLLVFSLLIDIIKLFFIIYYYYIILYPDLISFITSDNSIRQTHDSD